MVWRGIVFHTCGILTDGFSAGFWKHMQYFKHNSEHSSVSTFFSTQEMLQYIQITYQPSCKADTHVSIVDVEHVNLCWRFNSLDACSVPTERERDRGESVNFTQWSEGKTGSVQSKSTGHLNEKVYHQIAPTGIHCMAPIYQHFVDGKREYKWS